MSKKRIVANLYTKGRMGRRFRETLDRDNEYLYSGGYYPTKIKVEDLPEDYIPIFSRVINYLHGYLKMSGVVDMAYTWVKENHLFKDDYIYISYHEPLKMETNAWGFKDYTNYDVCICGNSIIDIVLAAEKYSNFDTSKVREEIEKKRVWLRDHEPEYYDSFIHEDVDIFTWWEKNNM